MRRRRKQRRRRRRGRRRRNLRSRGRAGRGRQAGGVSTIVLKTPGWNSKDVAESPSPSFLPSRRGPYPTTRRPFRHARAARARPPARLPNPLMLRVELTTLLSLQKQNFVFALSLRPTVFLKGHDNDYGGRPPSFVDRPSYCPPSA